MVSEPGQPPLPHPTYPSSLCQTRLRKSRSLQNRSEERQRDAIQTEFEVILQSDRVLITENHPKVMESKSSLRNGDGD